jgi:hypothetical protein
VKFKIHHGDDELIVEGETVEETRAKAQEELKKRGWKDDDCWSEKWYDEFIEPKEEPKILTLDQQIAMMAKYIELNHPDDIKGDERVVETAIRIMENQAKYIKMLEAGLDQIKEKLDGLETTLRHEGYIM